MEKEWIFILIIIPIRIFIVVSVVIADTTEQHSFGSLSPLECEYECECSSDDDGKITILPSREEGSIIR